MRSDPRIRIFPEYFDKSITRAKGRKVSTKLAFENPNLNEIKIAAQKLGFTVDYDQEKAYPKSWQTPKGLLYLSNENGEKIDLKKSKILRDLSKTVITFARPKILEYKKHKEQELKEKKKPGKKITKKIDNKPKKPTRRRR